MAELGTSNPGGWSDEVRPLRVHSLQACLQVARALAATRLRTCRRGWVGCQPTRPRDPAPRPMMHGKPSELKRLPAQRQRMRLVDPAGIAFRLADAIGLAEKVIAVDLAMAGTADQPRRRIFTSGRCPQRSDRKETSQRLAAPELRGPFRVLAGSWNGPAFQPRCSRDRGTRDLERE